MTLAEPYNRADPFGDLEPEPVSKLEPDDDLVDEEREEWNILAGVRSGAWLDAQEFPPLEYSVPGIIAEGATLFVGSPKTGKSWFALGIGLAVAAGGKALGALEVEPGPVLYLGLEDGDRRMQHRARQLLAGAPIPGDFHYLTRTTSTAKRTLAAWLNRYPTTRLLVVDTLGKIAQQSRPGESQYLADYNSIGPLQELTTDHPGTSLLIVHHTRKAQASDFLDSASGTQGLAGAVDSVIALNRERHSDDARLSVTGREVNEAEYALRRGISGGWLLSGGSLAEARQAAERQRLEAVASRKGGVVQSIVDLVNSREATTPKDVEKFLGVDNNKASTYLRRAYDDGLIERPQRGVYTPKPPVESVESGKAGEPDSHFHNSTLSTPPLSESGR